MEISKKRTDKSLYPFILTSNNNLLVNFDNDLFAYFDEKGELLRLSTEREWSYLASKLSIKYVRIRKPYIPHQIEFGEIHVPDEEELTRTLVGRLYNHGKYLLVEFDQEIWHGYEGALGRQNLNRVIRKKYPLSHFPKLIKGLYPYRECELYLGFCYRYITETNDQIATLKARIYNHQLEFYVQFYGDLWHGYEGAPGLINFLYPEDEESFDTLEQIKAEYEIRLNDEFEKLFN